METQIKGLLDLKKAYDAVSREVMWLTLDKLGVPQKFVKLFRNTKATIK